MVNYAVSLYVFTMTGSYWLGCGTLFVLVSMVISQAT